MGFSLNSFDPRYTLFFLNLRQHLILDAKNSVAFLLDL